MQLPDEPERPFQINIVPMIDVIFAVLTFFILATLVLSREKGLPVNLPDAATASSQQATLTVTINASGDLFLNQEPITLDGLNGGVEAKLDPKVSSLVVIRADAAVPHGRVVAVMDRLRRIRGISLGIAAQMPSE